MYCVTCAASVLHFLRHRVSVVSMWFRPVALALRRESDPCHTFVGRRMAAVLVAMLPNRCHHPWQTPAVALALQVGYRLGGGGGQFRGSSIEGRSRGGENGRCFLSDRPRSYSTLVARLPSS